MTLDGAEGMGRRRLNFQSGTELFTRDRYGQVGIWLWGGRKDAEYVTWCEPNCPIFYHFCIRQCMQFSLFHSFFDHRQGWMGRQKIYGERKEERIRPNKRELHEQLYTEIVKSGTIRFAFGLVGTVLQGKDYQN